MKSIFLFFIFLSLISIAQAEFIAPNDYNQYKNNPNFLIENIDDHYEVRYQMIEGKKNGTAIFMDKSGLYLYEMEYQNDIMINLKPINQEYPRYFNNR